MNGNFDFDKELSALVDRALQNSDPQVLAQSLLVRSNALKRLEKPEEKEKTNV